MKRYIQFVIAGLLTMAAFSLSSCQQDEALVSSLNDVSVATRDASVQRSRVIVCSIKTDTIGQVKEKVQAFVQQQEDIVVENIDSLYVEGPANISDMEYILSLQYLDSISFEKVIPYDNGGNRISGFSSYTFSAYNNYYLRAKAALYLPDSISWIGERCFYGSGLRAVYMDNVKEINWEAFAECTNLQTVRLSDSLKIIRGYCFASSGLKNIKIPDNSVSLGDCIFSNCSNLQTVQLSKKITELPNECFYNCSSLKYIDLPFSLKIIGERCFTGSGLESVIIPDDVVSMKVAAFSSCSNLQTVQLSKKITELPRACFYKCSSLKYIDLPFSLKIIGEYCFDSSGLESVIIPDDVVSMSNEVFCDCSNLQTVQWPEELHTIPSSTFYNCSRLKFDIPAHITSIGENAFHGCDSITRFDIPAGVTSIGDGAFANTGITDLPENLPYITSSMFAGCDQLVNVDIPEGIEEIGNNAFRGCSSLRGITAPASVKEAGSTLSEECPQLSYVIWKSAQADVPYCGDADNLLVYLPNGGTSHSSNQNIINKGQAASIHLTYQSGNPFYCPEQFTAESIEITQNFGEEYYTDDYGWGNWSDHYTGTGVAARWRSISLPFTVTKIKSEGKGELAPFHSEKQESGDVKPFWLCEMTTDDFQPATQIEAYKPYLLAMPNNPEYMDEYNITDNVTFSATNAVVGKTPDAIDSSPVGKGGWALTPVFAKVAKSLDIYCLNEKPFEKNGVDYPVGSCFRSNDRGAYTFEAIVKIDGGAARSILPLGQNLSRGAARPLGRVPQPEDMPLP